MNPPTKPSVVTLNQFDNANGSKQPAIKQPTILTTNVAMNFFMKLTEDVG